MPSNFDEHMVQTIREAQMLASDPETDHIAKKYLIELMNIIDTLKKSDDSGASENEAQYYKKRYNNANTSLEKMKSGRQALLAKMSELIKKMAGDAQKIVETSEAESDTQKRGKDIIATLKEFIVEINK